MRCVRLGPAHKGRCRRFHRWRSGPRATDRKVIPTYVTDDERQRFYRQLLGIAQRRGHSPGFAFYKFQEKFAGAKPPWDWKALPPLDPEPHIEAWVRSRQIAWAKSQKSGGRSRP